MGSHWRRIAISSYVLFAGEGDLGRGGAGAGAGAGARVSKPFA